MTEPNATESVEDNCVVYSTKQYAIYTGKVMQRPHKYDRQRMSKYVIVQRHAAIIVNPTHEALHFVAKDGVLCFAIPEVICKYVYLKLPKEPPVGYEASCSTYPPMRRAFATLEGELRTMAVVLNWHKRVRGERTVVYK